MPTTTISSNVDTRAWSSAHASNDDGNQQARGLRLFIRRCSQKAVSAQQGTTARVEAYIQRRRARRQLAAQRIVELFTAFFRPLRERAAARETAAALESSPPSPSSSSSSSSSTWSSGMKAATAATVPLAMIAATAVAAQQPAFQKRIAKLVQSSIKNFVHTFEGPRRDTLVLLLSTTLVVPIMTRLKTSPILGFLLTGMILGPRGLSVVNDIKTTEALAELGIVFFLFEMGLELSVQRLISMRRDVFGLGFAQFSFSAVAIFIISRMLGLPGPTSIVVGGALALSSSAFVLQLLRDKDSLGTRHGRASFGVLLFQDLAVVPLLVVTPLLTAGGGSAMAWAMGWAACKAGLAFAVILLFGKYLLDKIFNFVADSKSHEAFLAVILVTVLTMSNLTEGLGLSNTLGAFLAGVLLSETKYRYQVEADIAPFRGLLLGLFFMTVGFEIDINLIRSQFPTIMGLLGGLLVLKTTILTTLCLAFGLSLSNAQHVGLLLSQGGEFAFVAFGMAKALGILAPPMAKLLLTTVALSMAVTPVLDEMGNIISERIENKYGFSHYVGADAEGEVIKATQSDFVVVCGYGRIGKMVCDLLDKKFIPYVAFDVNPAKVIEARNRGLPVFFGDVSRPEVLRSFNVDKARSVVVTTNEMSSTNKAVVTLRKLYPKMPIFARAADMAHQKRLQNTLEVSAMVPILPEDSVLLSLPFGGRVLRKMGVSPEEVDVMMDDMRKKALSDIFGVEEDSEGDEIIGVIQTIKKKGAVAAQALSQQQSQKEAQQLKEQQQAAAAAATTDGAMPQPA